MSIERKLNDHKKDSSSIERKIDRHKNNYLSENEAGSDYNEKKDSSSNETESFFLSQDDDFSVSDTEDDSTKDDDVSMNEIIPVGYNRVGVIKHDYLILQELFKGSHIDFGELAVGEWDENLSSIDDIDFLIRSMYDMIVHDNRVVLIGKSTNEEGYGVKSIPERICNTDLRALYLENNNIDEIPSCIGSLIYLEKLKLRTNKIQSIPDNLFSLPVLDDLDLRKNMIHDVQHNIGDADSLRKLDLGDNYIDFLPDSISKLKNLEYLRISNNNITSLPDSFEILTNINELYATKLSLNHSSVEILDYLSDKGVEVHY